MKGVPLILGLLLAGAPPASPAEKGVEGRASKGTEKNGQARPPSEVRGIWVTRWDFRTEKDVRRIIASCAALGLNQVMFQVRGEADAFYRSTLEPWGEELEGPPERGGDPGFDPLGVAIDEAKVRGVSLHAWANALTGWRGSAPPREKSHIVHRHPDWFVTDQLGRRKILDPQRYAMLNPCLAAVRAHLVKVMSEIAGRYAVDGIQIDYIRFLDRDPSRGEDVSYDAETLALFKAEAGGSPEERPEAWDRFRSRAVDRLVLEISKGIRAQRPSARISVAAIRDSSHARRYLFQDAEGWKRRGWIDGIYPMAYEAELVCFRDTTRRWIEACGGSAVVAGIGVHLLDSEVALRDQVKILRAGPPEKRPAGYCLFAYSEFLPSPSPQSRKDSFSVDRRSRLRAVLKALNQPSPRVDAQ